MLDDRHSGSVELGHALERGVGIVEVVVRQFLALHLVRGCHAGTRPGGVEGRFLMRVLAIAQRLPQAAGDRQPLRECFLALTPRTMPKSRRRRRRCGRRPLPPDAGATTARCRPGGRSRPERHHIDPDQSRPRQNRGSSRRHGSARGRRYRCSRRSHRTSASLATVASNGYRLTTTRSIGAIPCSRICSRCSATSRRARIPP